MCEIPLSLDGGKRQEQLHSETVQTDETFSTRELHRWVAECERGCLCHTQSRVFLCAFMLRFWTFSCRSTFPLKRLYFGIQLCHLQLYCSIEIGPDLAAARGVLLAETGTFWLQRHARCSCAAASLSTFSSIFLIISPSFVVQTLAFDCDMVDVGMICELVVH